MAKNTVVGMYFTKSAFENGLKKLQPVLSVCVNFLLMIIRLNLIELKRGKNLHFQECSGTFLKIFLGIVNCNWLMKNVASELIIFPPQCLDNSFNSEIVLFF